MVAEEILLLDSAGGPMALTVRLHLSPRPDTNRLYHGATLELQKGEGDYRVHANSYRILWRQHRAMGNSDAFFEPRSDTGICDEETAQVLFSHLTPEPTIVGDLKCNFSFYYLCSDRVM